MKDSMSVVTVALSGNSWAALSDAFVTAEKRLGQSEKFCALIVSWDVYLIVCQIMRRESFTSSLSMFSGPVFSDSFVTVMGLRLFIGHDVDKKNLAFKVAMPVRVDVGLCRRCYEAKACSNYIEVFERCLFRDVLVCPFSEGRCKVSASIQEPPDNCPYFLEQSIMIESELDGLEF